MVDKTATQAEELRSRRGRDPRTGRFLPKPTPPAMRVVEKGAWNYREVTGRRVTPPEQNRSR